MKLLKNKKGRNKIKILNKKIGVYLIITFILNKIFVLLKYIYKIYIFKYIQKYNNKIINYSNNIYILEGKNISKEN